MYSEGCGLGEPLWAGEYAINQTGLFVRHIHTTGRLPYKLKVEAQFLGINMINLGIRIAFVLGLDVGGGQVMPTFFVEDATVPS